MKKIFISLLAILLAFSALVGCNKKDASDNTDSTPSKSDSAEENKEEIGNENNSLPDMPWVGEPIELPTDEWD